MKVAFRVDASVEIGIGHVMRCLTLADELRTYNAEITFVCREYQGHLCQLISSRGFSAIRLPLDTSFRHALSKTTPKDTARRRSLKTYWEVDAEQTAIALDKAASLDWLVVDHYALDVRWETRARRLSRKILVIDDLANRRHDCDILLDQNRYHQQEKRYAGLLPAACIQLLGPKYALLRREFTIERRYITQQIETVQRILVSFGGSDQYNMTAVALRALSIIPPSFTIDVVVGDSNPHKDEIRRLCQEDPKITYHYKTPNMARLMTRASFFIGAGGATTWERACVGLPSLIISVAENQKAVAQTLEDLGCQAYLGHHTDVTPQSLAAQLLDIINDKETLSRMRSRSLELTSGTGSKRVCAHIMGDTNALASSNE